jgi:uncharacterized membrane protein YgcG
MFWLEVVTLIVLVVGFLSLYWGLSAMREEMDNEFEALAEELAGISSVAESAVALIEHQNEQLRSLVNSDADAGEIKTRLSALVDAGEAVKVRLANAVAANTAATSDEKPTEEPLPEPEPTAGTDTGGASSGGDTSGASGGDASGSTGGDTSTGGGESGSGGEGQ